MNASLVMVNATGIPVVTDVTLEGDETRRVGNAVFVICGSYVEVVIAVMLWSRGVENSNC